MKACGRSERKKKWERFHHNPFGTIERWYPWQDPVSHFAELQGCLRQTPEWCILECIIAAPPPPLLVSEAPIKNFPWFSNIVVFWKHHTAYSHFPHVSDLLSLTRGWRRRFMFRTLLNNENDMKSNRWNIMIRFERQKNKTRLFRKTSGCDSSIAL